MIQKKNQINSTIDISIHNSMGYKFFHQPKEFLSKVRFDFTLPTNFGVEEQVEP